MNPENYSTISFPALGFSWDPARSFSIGPLTINFYGLIIAIGLMLAVVYGCKRAKQFGMSVDDLTDGVLFIVPFAIVCARLYYCIFSWKDYADDPISILYIWKGGLAIYGGVIGAGIGIVVFSLVKKIKVGAVLDITSLGFLIGQSIGRWGNFFNREAFGAETESFLRMGLTNKITGQITYYHPTFLYESLWNAAGFVLLHFLSKKRKFDGQIVLGYLAWYGLGRTFIEGLRLDSLYWGDFRVSQLLAACTCFVGVALLMVNAFRDHDPAKLQANIYAAKLAALDAAEMEESLEEEEHE
jgi:phosphatidylglycerol:prolipoprotein diacylglycerol transferase